MGGVRVRTQSGSSLLEVCVALVILLSVFPALMLFLVTVLRANALVTDNNYTNSVNRAQTQAESYVKSGLPYTTCSVAMGDDALKAFNAEFSPTTTTTTPVGPTTTTTVGPTTTTTTVLAAAPTFEIVSIKSREPLSAAAGLAIDGSSVWATDAGADSLSKIDRATNQVTKKLKDVGDSPQGVAVGASKVWVANFAAGTVSRVNPDTTPLAISDGDRIRVGVGPYGVAFAGGYVWVTNSGTETTSSNTVSKINPNTPLTPETITVGNGPRGIASDGTYMWVANSKDETVSRINILDSTVSTFPLTKTPGESIEREGVTVGAGSVWVANAGSNSVTRINPATGLEIGTIPVGLKNGPQGLSFDGASVWVSSFGSDSVWKIDPATNSATTASATVQDPIGIAADSTAVWVAGSTGGTVSRLTPPAGSLAATVDISLGPCIEPAPTVNEETGVQVWTVEVTSGSKVKVFEFLKVKR
jgi:YVTN family beta-propeller protein